MLSMQDSMKGMYQAPRYLIMASVHGTRGLVAVKFSKEFKQHIRDPWARALIVKVYGKSVGFHFLQSKLISLWKPAGRMDCVNLGNRFFLVRLSLKEDFENVLKKCPWLIGEHFLSLWPREPNFRHSLANISSVAVWVRLNKLPIEYYNAKALHHIGNSIGNVLQVDTFTASESKGSLPMRAAEMGVEEKRDEHSCSKREQNKTNIKVGLDDVQKDMLKDV
nr:hypothetical protein CFP56_44114 [Quercus suber]POF16126.1 hypothetical protein CFP56_15617 [Quercus suber]